MSPQSQIEEDSPLAVGPEPESEDSHSKQTWLIVIISPSIYPHHWLSTQHNAITHIKANARNDWTTPSIDLPEISFSFGRLSKPCSFFSPLCSSISCILKISKPAFYLLIHGEQELFLFSLFSFLFWSWSWSKDLQFMGGNIASGVFQFQFQFRFRFRMLFSFILVTFCFSFCSLRRRRIYLHESALIDLNEEKLSYPSG